MTLCLRGIRQVGKIFMAYTNHCKSIIREEFFKPLFEVLQGSKQGRNCAVLDDALWLEAGVRRCLGLYQSGRDFLQNLAEFHDTPVRVSTWFESLKSKRRLGLLDEVGALVRARMKRFMPDPFHDHECLRDFDLLAGDGHFVAAAAHDKAAPCAEKTKTAKDGNASSGTTRQVVNKYATGHVYALDLRSHAMSHLAVADQINRKKEHEMRALKRQTADTLRQGAPKGRKVLYVWDRACIDFQQWHQWKHQSGIYFLSREKENMKPAVMGNHPFSTSDPGNTGVLADEIIGTSQGVSVRRVTFRDPETSVVYKYLTNLPASIPPGIVALLYRVRWDIEKVFDEFKNKLAETKSWASSATAKTNHARLLCLAHNLMTLMEETIFQRTGVRNHAELKRRDKKRTTRTVEALEKSGGEIPHLQHAVERLTQRTVKFIRWLKNHLDLACAWGAAIAKLNQIYQHS